MAMWSVKPEWKKSIIERNYLVKDENTFMSETGWRWGEFIVYTEDDNPPDIESGVDIYNCEYETELVETSDGCWEDHDMDECDEETQQWLEEFFEEGNSWLDLEENGWSHSECEMIIACDLIIERLNDDGEPTGEIIRNASVEEETINVGTINPKADWPFPDPPVETAQFKCVSCEYSTEEIMDLLDNPNDDDKGALLCPKCNSKVDLV